MNTPVSARNSSKWRPVPDMKAICPSATRSTNPRAMKPARDGMPSLSKARRVTTIATSNTPSISSKIYMD